MALAAAHFETEGDAGERRALEWLESQPPPAMRFSEALERDVVGGYVPVNDVESGRELLPVWRTKQPKTTSPHVRPVEDTVHFLWMAQPDELVVRALGRLCDKVTRIGHSSSLVQAWVEASSDVEASAVLDDLGEFRLRVPSRGFLEQLEANFNGSAIAEYSRLQGELVNANPKVRKRLKEEIQQRFPSGPPQTRRPQIGTWQGYRTAERDGACAENRMTTPFDSGLLVLTKYEGPALGLESTLQLTGALRDAVMKASRQPLPEWLSGHKPDGGPSQSAHLAFLPLPFVGGQHGDGHLLGLALALPRGIDPGEIRDCLGPLFFDPESGKPRKVKLWKKDASDQCVWEWLLNREDRPSPPNALRAETWTGPSRFWASVTPVVLHRYPKRNRKGDVEAILRQACATAGLPEPTEVRTSPVSFFKGAGHVRNMPQYSEGGASLSQYQVHVSLAFDREIEGPVMIGRGRYRGYGFLRPPDKGERQ